MTGTFRAIVIAALVCHAVVLFVLPNATFLFSQDSLQLMRYGGHGAHIAMNHPILFAFYLVPFPAFVGLFYFKNWARHTLLLFLVVALLGSFAFGVSVSGPPETFFGYAASLLDGAIMALAFVSPLSQRFRNVDSVAASTPD